MSNAERQRRYRERHLSVCQRRVLMRLFRLEEVALIHAATLSALVRRGLVVHQPRAVWPKQFRLTKAGIDFARDMVVKEVEHASE